MNSKLISKVGNRMNKLTGVRAIMKDIKDTLSKTEQKYINLSPGNPVLLPEVAKLWRKSTMELMENEEFDEVVGRYGDSKGYEPFLMAILNDFNQRYNLNYGLQNIIVTPGSQFLYFLATNTFAGEFGSQSKKVLLPISPEYTGYGGVILDTKNIVARKPIIKKSLKTHRFKYYLDVNNLNINEDIGCIVLSRPCNPTGNILSGDEILQISSQAKPFGIPIFIDSAYNEPYPAINFIDSTPVFADNIVHCLTLAKAGLAGERIGIAIGDEKYIKPIEAFLTNSLIHSSRLGQAITAKLVNDGQLAKVSNNVIKPFYKNKAELISKTLDEVMPEQLSWYLHSTEGSIFAWMWFENLSISDIELYEKLKSKGLLVVPGSTFFPGLDEEIWKHKQECIRLSFTATDEEIVEACKIISATISNLI